MSNTYSHLFNIPTTGLRFFTVYGPWGRPDMAPILFANAITNGNPIKVFNNGDLERDFTYIDDIVEGITKVISQKTEVGSRKSPYSIHNIGNGTPVKLMDFIKTIENAIGKKAEKIMLPMQPGDVHKTFADVSTLKMQYNYEPNTSLNEGIKEFTDWYKMYYKK